MKRSTSTSIRLIFSSFIVVLAFQNCAKVGTYSTLNSASLQAGAGPGESDSGDGISDDIAHESEEESAWLYIPGGRGHVPMSSVAICPAGSKDEGSQKCPFFCYHGVDYLMHKSLAREYFAVKFDEVPGYGGGAVPGTCAAPDLKIKQ
ncbi:hypothetical protein ACLVWU_06215 [Bdellovibrio sp. HCB290]|uniref:hypothetical protein n=1 Tax=Bdellovibrio sp. HCB290 TaxID=3394356 RepID=UPI0039B37139